MADLLAEAGARGRAHHVAAGEPAHMTGSAATVFPCHLKKIRHFVRPFFCLIRFFFWRLAAALIAV
ncbi:MAG: hypothetical protein JSR87_12600 [Proteobacteria bacterium]|nr:hypothetical protein [Pseudomonadota bacterium]MBS0574454.1 hypothetical protein [Pseudomonadota bacterium]